MGAVFPPSCGLWRQGLTVLDLGPGLGRDCFIAARKVGPAGRVYGLDMNSEMLKKARAFQVSGGGRPRL